MKKMWHKWANLAEKIGNFQITVIFSLLYFILVLPIGLIAKSKHIFTRKVEWEKIKNSTSSLEKLRQQ